MAEANIDKGVQNKWCQIGDYYGLKSVENLCLLKAPYDRPAGYSGLFINAMKEVLEHHLKMSNNNSNFYKNLFNHKNFSTKDLKEIGDLEKIPFIHANFFKKHEILSINKEKVFLHLTSSGTTGQKSQVFFDEWSIRSAQKMVDNIFEYYGWVNENSFANYLLYTYEPEEGSKLGTAYTDNFLCKYVPVNKVKYALKYYGSNKHHFDIFGVIESLKQFEKENLPVRIFGFPSFFYFTLEKMRELNVAPLKLHNDSLVFLGGGWKKHQNEAIEKKDLYKLANELLGIPDERLRDGFGSVEHCIPYIECRNHNFHVPVWSHVIIRDLLTLENIGYDRIGYLNFISPYITSMPANSVLMGDLAVLHKGERCGCGIMQDYFQIVGRAGKSANKSCAISASEMLRNM